MDRILIHAEKNNVDRIEYEGDYNEELPFQILPNIENQKFFGARLGTILCANFDSYTKDDRILYKFELNEDDLSEDLPDDLYYDYLLFENLGNGQIKEIISGTIFNVCFLQADYKNKDTYVKSNEIFDSERSIVDVQNNGDFEKILETPLGIWIGATLHDLNGVALNCYNQSEIKTNLLDDNMDNYDFAYKLDDNFKEYYSKNILPKKDLVIKTLKKAEAIAKKNVKERIENEISKLYGIALTENAIYDYEHKKSTK
ncbi:MAG: hypothetical protein E7170_05130 [Firmicutes bacterium]|nr:hypothetical protein [Bacillota bacterium]